MSTSNLYYLHADHQGSIIAHSNGTGSRTKHNNFDEYGIPGQTNTGLFAYTGQIVLPGSNTTAHQTLYHYKARVYHPRLGRFLQTDPIGYEDQMNLYAYVGNDPMTNVDPSGKWLLNAVNALIGAHTAWEAVKDSNASGTSKFLAVTGGAVIGFFAGKAGSKGISTVAQHFTRSSLQSTVRATGTVAAGAVTGGFTGGATEIAANGAVGRLPSASDLTSSIGTGAIAGAIGVTPATLGATGMIPNAIGVLTGELVLQGASAARASESTNSQNNNTQAESGNGSSNRRTPFGLDFCDGNFENC